MLKLTAGTSSNGMLVDVPDTPPKPSGHSTPASTSTSLSVSTDIDTDESVDVEVKKDE